MAVLPKYLKADAAIRMIQNLTRHNGKFYAKVCFNTMRMIVKFCE